MFVPRELHATLLQKMQYKAFVAPAARMYGTLMPIADEAECQRQLDNLGSRKYFDYFGGRAIKTDFSTEEINFRLYNRDAGPNAGEELANEIIAAANLESPDPA